jgi:tRNA dimethylallyltransferase
VTRVIAVIGPTASGKTELGIALAQHLGGEIVNADAYQCYRGMDIGTAKPTAAEQQAVRHHCLDLFDPSEDVSLERWRTHAVEAIESLEIAVVVGGSGLYVRALLDDWELPGTDPELRADLNRELDDQGSAALHRRLQALDPQAAADILPGNGRRIVRALEVIALTGGPFRARLPEPGPMRWDATIVALAPEADTIDARIDERATRMWADGLVREATSLDLGRTASKAIGYAQALAQDRGELSEAEAIGATALATRQYVRRQRKWWARDPRVLHLVPTYVAGRLDTSSLLAQASP